MFPVGTQYHRPPTPKAEKWEGDFALMHKSGFNIARGWAMWSWLNPSEGKYDFSELERMCDLGKKNGVGIILLVDIESVPAWMYKKYPHTTYVSRTGKPIAPHTVHNRCIGGHPGLCTDHPEVQKAAKAFIKALVTKFKNHPGLVAWEPHNEPLIEPARYNHEVFCYCEATSARFRTWLKKKYTNIQAVNKAWQRKFNNFEEIDPPTELGSFPDWTDWRMFAIDCLVDQDRWRIQTIRENDPKHEVLMHSRGGGDRRDIVCDGTDDWRLFAMADKVGYANFPQGKTPFEHALSGDICRSAAQGKEFWMHELQSGPFGIGMNRNNPFWILLGKGGAMDVDVAARPDEVGDVTGDRIAMWSWMSISQGAKGLLYWQFRTEQFGAEYGFNLVNLDGTPNERLDAAAHIAKVISSNEKMFTEMKPPASQVAIGYSPRNAMLTYFADGNLNSYLAAYLGANRLLQHLGHQLDVVRVDTDAVNDDYSKYKAVYVPLPLQVQPEIAAKLEKFVANGGLLICEPSLGAIEMDGFSADVVPSAGLDKLFGVRREIVSTRQSIDVKIGATKVPSRFFEEILIPQGAKVMGKYADGRVAMTVNNYGKGKAIYMGTSMLMEYIFSESAAARSVFGKLNAEAGITNWASTGNPDTFVRYMERKGQKLVFLFNGFNKVTKATLTLQAKVSSAMDLWSDKKVAFKTVGKTSQAAFTMKPYDTKILLVEGV